METEKSKSLESLIEQDMVMVSGQPSTYLEIRHYLLRQKDASVIADRIDPKYFTSRQHLLRRRNLEEQRRLYRDADYFSRQAATTGIPMLTRSQSRDTRETSSFVDSDSRIADFENFDEGAGVASGSGVKGSPVASSLAAPPLTELSEFAARSSREPVSKAYSFSGLFHVFSQNSDACTCVEFAHDSVDLIAWGSMDTTVHIAKLGRETGPNAGPKILHVLKSHTKQVNSVSWSQDNERLVSSSNDGTARVWNTYTGDCLRIAHFNVAVNCAKFYPLNDNLLLVGTDGDGLIIFNLSTGKARQRLRASKLFTRKEVVTALETDATGTKIFVGTSNGSLSMFTASRGDLTFHRATEKRFGNTPNSSITSIRFSEWQTGTHHPTLLLNVRGLPAPPGSGKDSIKYEGRLAVVGVVERKQKFSFELERCFAMAHQHYNIGSRFCPLISHRSGVCVVSGSEDGAVFVLDITKPQTHDKKAVVNRLEGHQGAVLDVDFDYTESLLASCDATGVVILWKRKEPELNNSDF